MFGVSFGELIVVMLVILIVFGPDKLPELATKFGLFMSEMRKASDAVRREFYNSLYKPSPGEFKSLNRDLKTAVPPANPVPPAAAAPPAPVPFSNETKEAPKT